MNLQTLRRVGDYWNSVASLTRLASPHHTSRDASYTLHIHCDFSDGIFVAVAGVGSPRNLSTRKTPWSPSSCPRQPAFKAIEGHRRCPFL